MSTPPPLPSSSSPRTPVALAIGLICLTLAFLAVAWRFFGLDDPGPIARFVVPGVSFFLCGVSFFCLLLGRRNSSGERWIAGIAASIAGVGMLALLGVLGWEVIGLTQSKFAPIVRKVATRTQRENSRDGVNAAEQAIPQDQKALTLKEVAPLYQSWAERHLVANYEQHGRKDPRWDDLVRKIIRGGFARRLKMPDRPSAEEFRGWLEEASTAGCNEPLVKLAEALDPQFSGLREETLEAVEDQLGDRPDSAGAKFLTHLSLWNEVRNAEAGAARQLAKACLTDLRAVLEQGPLPAGDYWFWHHFLITDSDGDFIENHGPAIAEVLAGSPSVEPWFVHRIRGCVEVDLAWKARGSGWANSVTRDGWRGFEDHLGSARTELTKAWELHPEHPGAASQMITVCLGGSNAPAREMREWFDRAVSARLDYLPAYKVFLWGMRPRWHGSEAAMTAFGTACLETHRFDTEVPWQFLQAHRDLASEWDEPEAYYPERLPWEETKSMIEGYLAEPTMQSRRIHTCTVGAILAEKCRRMQDCRRYLEAAGFKVDPEALQEWSLSASWGERAAALSGPAASLITSAENAPPSQALELFQQALAKLENAPAGDPSREYVGSRVASLEAARKLADAPWESLRPAEGQGVWEERHEESGWTPDGVLEQSAGSITLINLPTGGAFEIRGDVELPANTQLESGFYVGSNDIDSSDWITTRLRFKKDGKSSVIYSRKFSNDSFVKRPQLSRRGKVMLRVAGGELLMTVDNREVMRRRIHVPAATLPDSRVGLITSSEEKDYVVRWRNLEWRRVPTLAR